MGNSYNGHRLLNKETVDKRGQYPSQVFAKEMELFTTNSSPAMTNTLQLEKLSFWVCFILSNLNKTTSTQLSNFLNEKFQCSKWKISIAKYVSMMLESVK